MITNKHILTGMLITAGAIFIATIAGPLQSAKNVINDQAIEDDFYKLSLVIEDYYTQKGYLPSELKDVKLSASLSANLNKNSYEYKRTSQRKYQLCAVFKTESVDRFDENWDRPTINNLEPYSITDGFGAHRSGYDCIDFEVFNDVYDYDYEYDPDEIDFDSEIDDLLRNNEILPSDI